MNESGEVIDGSHSPSVNPIAYRSIPDSAAPGNKPVGKFWIRHVSLGYFASMLDKECILNSETLPDTAIIFGLQMLHHRFPNLKGLGCSAETPTPRLCEPYDFEIHHCPQREHWWSSFMYNHKVYVIDTLWNS